MAVRMRKVLQTAGLVFECVTCFFRVSLQKMVAFLALFNIAQGEKGRVGKGGGWSNDL